MALVVCKFGGSSLSDADMFLKVRDILLSSSDRRYAVVSAPGKRTPNDEKITDLLYRAYEAGGAGDHSIFAQIFQRYASIRNRLAPEFDLEAEFARIRSRKACTADYMVSRGEYICAKLFAAFMGWPFVDAADLFIFRNGKIDPEESRRRVQERLCGLDRAVIPGFYGAAEGCGIQTFSRGGSDVSGALLAASLNAELYENWTDVEGLFSADPNIVPDALRHPLVSLSQMERIAARGGKLLHPDALAPLRGSGIETRICSTRAPSEPGTSVNESFRTTVPCVTGLSGLFMLEEDHCGAQLPLVHSTPIAGARRVDVISVFGLPDELTGAVKAAVSPIHIIHMQDHKQIIIEEGSYAASVRKIHSILMYG